MYKICWVAHHINKKGGNSKRFKLWLKYIDTSNFKVDFIYGPPEKNNLKDYFFYTDMKNINLIPDKRLYTSGINNYKSIKALKHHFKKNKYDVIHSLRSISDILVPFTIKDLKNTKIVTTIAGTQYKNRSIVKRSIYKLFYLKWRKYFSKLITVSAFNRKKMIFEYKVNPEKISVSKIGIDFSELDSRKLVGNKKIKMITFGFAGRFTKNKGIQYLLKAIKKIAKKYSNKKVRFVLAGDGDNFKKIKQQIIKYKINDYIILLGWVQNINNFLKNIDVLILPSLDEGTPRIILEAYYYKIPVIATNVGGVGEIVNNNTGMLIPPQNSIKLSVAIEKFINNNVDITTLGENARNYVVKNHNIKDEIKRLENIYKLLIEENASKKLNL